MGKIKMVIAIPFAGFEACLIGMAIENRFQESLAIVSMLDKIASQSIK